MRRVDYIFTRNASRPVPRILRQMTFLKDNGFSSAFVGQRRDVHTDVQGCIEDFEYLLLGGIHKPLGGNSVTGYISGLIAYNWYLFGYLVRNRPKYVVASDFESFPASRLASWLIGSKLCYNIHDNLAQRYSLPIALKKTLNILEGINVLLSNRASTPADFRTNALPNWSNKRIITIPNVPSGPLPIKNQAKSNETITIGYVGWINETRGIKYLVDAAKANNKLQIRIAGSGDDSLLETIQNTVRVEYLGVLSREASLQVISECDFVFSYYSPMEEININSASNKIAESLAIGTPLLINSELKVAKQIKKFKCSIQGSYRRGIDVEELLSISQAEYSKMILSSHEAFMALYDTTIVNTNTSKFLCLD